MYKKLIAAAVLLLALTSFQYVSSLECWQCYNVNYTCSSLSSVTCSESTANTTVNHLKDHFYNVPNVKSSNFDCLTMNYTQSNGYSPALELRGCIYRETYPCNLSVNTTVGSGWTKQNCTTCSGNLCNSRSPAGTFSTSLFTLFAGVLSVLLAKVFVL